MCKSGGNMFKWMVEKGALRLNKTSGVKAYCGTIGLKLPSTYIPTRN